MARGFLHRANSLAIQAGHCLELRGACPQPLNFGIPGDERICIEQMQRIASVTEAADEVSGCSWSGTGMVGSATGFPREFPMTARTTCVTL